jgi:hypothetical protein
LKAVIEFGGDKYNVVTDDNGKISIMRFNTKYKMWVKINFSDNPKDCDVDKYIIDILSKQYVENITQIV